jgi:ferrous iron transport protein A
MNLITAKAVQRLGELEPGDTAIVVSVVSPLSLSGSPATKEEDPIARRLLEMGVTDGSVVEVMYEAPFGGDPIAVKIRGALLGLRREEADYIMVSEVKHGKL